MGVSAMGIAGLYTCELGRLRRLVNRRVGNGATADDLAQQAFVRLMSPHLTTMPGIRRPIQPLICASLLGSLFRLAADWARRMALFPNEVPAGLVASLIGAPCLLWLMRRSAA